MEICFLSLGSCSTFYPENDSSIGGTEQQLFLLSRYFALDKKNIVSFILSDHSQKERDFKYGIHLINSGIKIKKVSKLSKFLAPFRILSALHKARADVYICSAAGPEAGIVAFYTMLLKKKFIYRTAHDMDCNGDYIRENFLKGLLFKFALKKSSLIITQTKQNRKMLLNENYESIVIKNAFEVTEGGRVINKDYILWVSGRCEQRKRPDLFIELVKAIPLQKFKMVCTPATDESLYIKIRELARPLKNLEFIKSVPLERIQSYFNNSKIFVSTSESEGFPNTFLQACNAETPIVSLKVDPDKFIENYNCGEIAKGDLSLFINKVRALLINESKASLFGKNAKQYLIKNHKISNIGDKWLQAIQELS